MQKRRLRFLLLFCLIAIPALVYYHLLPSVLFEDPRATVMYDRDGNLLGAHIADDGQWRFPANDSVPYKFAMALLQFEDRHFLEHNGVHLPSFSRAMWQNLSAGEVISGGSTITMQVIRMARKNPSRTIGEKLLELAMATRLEMRYSKEEILALYAANAPFGGNVVGLDAAAWRYFGRDAQTLSWAEATTLAVLPNAPSLIYPGKNQELLIAKRNRVLDRLQEIGVLSVEDCELAKAEELPGTPQPLPRLAPHLVQRSMKEGEKGQRIHTTLDANLQARVTQLLQRHSDELSGNGIYNAAAIIIDVETGATLAYVGNSAHPENAHGNAVDVITAPRSTGSILKPFLYAAMLQDGSILPNALVPDIPTRMQGFAPRNYYLNYDGAVPAHRALARSLNVPAVRMLQDYGPERFHYVLQRLPLPHINQAASHYGLTLILGGAESTLWEITGAYASMSRTLSLYRNRSGRYRSNDFRLPHFRQQEITEGDDMESSILEAGAIYLTWKALLEVNRPESETGYQFLHSSQNIAWKTGTSIGHRDAWAVGTNQRYAIGVWVGNADGEGRPNLTGVTAAAPLLFRLFDALPRSEWFDAPYDDMVEVAVCSKSGHRLLPHCEASDTVWAPKQAVLASACPWHQIIHLDETETWQVNSDCESPSKIQTRSWFVLPPVMEWYYRSKDPSYRTLPPWREDCGTDGTVAQMDLIYPRHDTQLYIPTEQDGTPGKAVFEVSHRESGTTIFWHIDNEFAGQTQGLHQLGVRPALGKHTLTLVDEDGNTISREFEVIHTPN